LVPECRLPFRRDFPPGRLLPLAERAPAATPLGAAALAVPAGLRSRHRLLVRRPGAGRSGSGEQLRPRPTQHRRRMVRVPADAAVEDAARLLRAAGPRRPDAAATRAGRGSRGLAPAALRGADGLLQPAGGPAAG